MIKEFNFKFNNELFKLSADEVFYEGVIKGLKYRIKDKDRNDTYLVWQNEKDEWVSDNESIDSDFLKKIGSNLQSK